MSGLFEQHGGLNLASAANIEVIKDQAWSLSNQVKTKWLKWSSKMYIIMITYL